MSHLIKATELKIDPKFYQQAAAHLGLICRAQSSVEIWHRPISNVKFAIALPGWSHPVAVHPDGSLTYDNYNGSWGKIDELVKLQGFAQMAACEEDLSSVRFTKTAQGQFEFVSQEA